MNEAEMLQALAVSGSQRAGPTTSALVWTIRECRQAVEAAPLSIIDGRVKDAAMSNTLENCLDALIRAVRLKN